MKVICFYFVKVADKIVAVLRGTELTEAKKQEIREKLGLEKFDIVTFKRVSSTEAFNYLRDVEKLTDDEIFNILQGDFIYYVK